MALELTAWNGLIRLTGGELQPFVDLSAAPYNVNEQLNGLGINYEGTLFYFTSFALGQASSRIYRYNSVTGDLDSWTAPDTSAQANNNNQVRRGAVDLSTGIYYYSTTMVVPKDSSKPYNSKTNPYTEESQRTHYIYGFDPFANGGQGGAWYAGSVQTPKGAQSGDITFDYQGNMYMSAGPIDSGNYVYVFNQKLPSYGESIPANYPVGKEINFIANGSLSGNVVGIAYAASGQLYISTTNSAFAKVDPITGEWTANGTPTGTTSTKALDSDDLASNASPSTLTVRKDVIGGRLRDVDQFTLHASRQTNGKALTVGTDITTVGNAVGVQNETVGPAPIVLSGSNVKDYSVQEATNGFSTFAGYVSGYECVDLANGKRQIAQGQLTQNSDTRQSELFGIPQLSGQETSRNVVCTITNTPATRTVTLTNTWVNAPEGDTADLTISGTGVETEQTQTSTATGKPNQTDSVNSASAQAYLGGTVNLSEVLGGANQAQYLASGYSCTASNGLSLSYTTDGVLTMPNDPSKLPSGAAIDCGVANSTQSLTLVKTVESKYADEDGKKNPADWNQKLHADSTVSDGVKLKYDSGEKKYVAEGAYKLSEDDDVLGYDQKDISCVDASDKKIVVSNGEVSIGNGQDVTCTIANTDKPGSVSWSKVDESGNRLSGSEWKILDSDGKIVVEDITDCVADDIAKCAGDDSDPKEGSFTFADQPWGTYYLVETKAPAGYVLPDPSDRVNWHSFTINEDGAFTADVGAISNKQKTPPTLPLTGGASADVYVIGGSILMVLALGIGFVIRRRSVLRG